MDLTRDNVKKTIVITGVTSGIGLATAMRLAGTGAAVIGVGRNAERCLKARDEIIAIYPASNVKILTADLSSMAQIRKLAAEIRATVSENGGDHIDVLINNAGTFSGWYVTTPEGFELQFAVNHLAPFFLTHELLPLLQKSPQGRIITVSSGSHYRTKMSWGDLFFKKRYNPLKAYKQSKLANVLFTCELNRRFGQNSNLSAFAVDPGLVNTEIGFKGTSGIVRWVWNIRSKSGISPWEGAATSAFLATEPKIDSCQKVYWYNCQPKEPSKYSHREDAAQQLWRISERMCGIRSADFIR